MAENPGKSRHDGQTEAKTLLTIPFGVAELIELLEDCLPPVLGDTRSGVADLDLDASCAPPASQQDFSTRRVGDCIGQKVAEHPFQQFRIRGNRSGTRHRAQDQPP